MLTKQTLRSIQSGTEKELYSEVTNVALYIATGGYLDSANAILSALWKYKMSHDRSTWLPDIAFMVLWNASGKYPNFIPFEIDDIDSIEKNMRGYVAMDKWAYKMPVIPWQEMSGQDLLRNAFITARLVKNEKSQYVAPESIFNPGSSDKPAGFSQLMSKVEEYLSSFSVQSSDSFPSAANELEALAMLEKMIEENYYSSEGLVLGAELAARHRQVDTAIQFAKLWAEETVRRDKGNGFPPIAACRHVAPVLLEGAIARELRLSDGVVEEYLWHLLEVLDNRMVVGRSLAFGDLSWRKLIENISKEAIRIEGNETYDEQVLDSKWIGFAGARGL